MELFQDKVTRNDSAMLLPSHAFLVRTKVISFKPEG